MNIFTALPSLLDGLKVLFGSRQERDSQDADARAAIYSQFGQEFRENRNWFDSLVDGLNRLPRPLFAYGTMYLFGLCWVDPVTFAEGARNLVLVPKEMWIILGAIIVFFFGGRMHEKFGEYKINEKMYDKVLKPSRELKTRESDIDMSDDADPQEGIKWNERISNRYNLND